MYDGISFLRNTKRIGDISEVTVLAALVKAGHRVSQPYGENNRYDLVIEKNAKFSRVQVKTGRLRSGAIVFNAYSSHSHRNGAAMRPYKGEIDFFGVYCFETDEVYLVPVDDVMIQAKCDGLSLIAWHLRLRLGW